LTAPSARPSGEGVSVRMGQDAPFAVAPAPGADLETLGQEASRIIRVLWSPSTWTLILLIVTIAIFSVLQPTAFLSWFNAKNIAINASPILLMAVGETFVLSASGLDLSVGSVLVLTSVLAVKGFEFAGTQGWAAVILGLVIALGAGLFIGCINGVLIAKARIPPLVVTLAMSFAAQGVGYIITGGNDLRDVPDDLVNSIGYSSILNIPDLVWISFAVVLIGSFVYYTTRFGRYTVVLGSNREAAIRAGIRVDRHIIKIYAVCGLTAGLAGYLSLSQYSGTQIGSHTQDFLYVILAVILGGTSFYGGVGSMLGTCIAVFVPWVLNFGFVVQGIDPFWQPVALGSIFVIVVYLDAWRRRAREGVRR
jgi:ribose transport system permease protein